MTRVEDINPYGDDRRAKTEQVRDMFDAIAPAYDFMNRAMTFGLDRLWLRSLVKAVKASRPGHIIDLATGTGDVAVALAGAIPSAGITGIDLSEGMLAKARERAAAKGMTLEFRQGDGLDTGLPDACTDAVTIAYGVRNYADIPAGLREIARILRPGGRVAILELSVPANPVTRPLYRLYTRLLIPAIGSMISGDRRAYSYLPESIAAAPQRADMTRLMEEAGLRDAKFKTLTLGVCTLYTATR